MMGSLRPEQLGDKIATIRKVVKTTADSQKELHTKLKNMTQINNRLAKSYDVSLRIIVDVSKLLNQYIAFFNEVDALLVQMDVLSSDTVTSDHIKYINQLTSENIDRMSSEFDSQLQNLLPMFEKNNLPSSHLREYQKLLQEINKESKTLISGGGLKIKPRIKNLTTPQAKAKRNAKNDLKRNSKK
jgi:ABC-type transporter Mla subunit MlaD